ncbi:MAG: HPr family phosphocarrier protein [Clostridia bacterium]
MIRKEIVFGQTDGLQSRSAALLVQVACKYNARVLIEQGSKVINAKSMMGVLSLGAKSEDKVYLAVEGEDEEQATEAIMRLIHSGFIIVS